MSYYDDVLNVNAYLRSKMRKNAEDSRTLAQRLNQQGVVLQGMINKVDTLLDDFQEIADSLGVDLSDIEMPQTEATNKFDCNDATELLISLPQDYDFAKAFEELRQEAHAAGFTNVQPEELLSAEEMASAEAFHEEIEARFEKATKLRGKDVLVMSIAIALRIICKVIFPVFKLKGEAEEKSKATQPSKAGQDQAAPLELPVAQQQPAALDAFSGVSVDDAFRSTKQASQTNITSSQVLSTITGMQPKMVNVKAYSQILSDPIPFDIPDNEFFAPKDALGYNKFLGWLFGVINIMTDTVTTKKMSSFSVLQPNGEVLHPTVNQKISTFRHLLLPIMSNKPRKEALLASVVREAGVQNLTKAPPEHVSNMLNRVFAEEEKALARIQNTAGFVQSVIPQLEKLPQKDQESKNKKNDKKNPLSVLPDIISDVTRDAAIIAFLNKLITAIHSVMYDPETDGPVEMYAIRTNDILTISNMIATGFNSLEAVITQNPARIDYAGVITSCISVFNSTRFWIDVKANYLFENYMTGIEEQMAIVDKYFVFTNE